MISAEAAESEERIGALMEELQDQANQTQMLTQDRHEHDAEVTKVTHELEDSRRGHFGVLALNEELQTRAERLQKLLQSTEEELASQYRMSAELDRELQGYRERTDSLLKTAESKEQATIRACVQRMLKKQLRMAFDALAGTAEEMKNRRAVMRRCLLRSQNMAMAGAFEGWAATTAEKTPTLANPACQK